MRDGFREIVSGWTLTSGLYDLTERIELAAKWTEVNGPLEADEEATIKLMIDAQIARGIAQAEPFIAGGGDDDDFLDDDFIYEEDGG